MSSRRRAGVGGSDHRPDPDRGIRRNTDDQADAGTTDADDDKVKDDKHHAFAVVSGVELPETGKKERQQHRNCRTFATAHLDSPLQRDARPFET